MNKVKMKMMAGTKDVVSFIIHDDCVKNAIE